MCAPFLGTAGTEHSCQGELDIGRILSVEPGHVDVCVWNMEARAE